jgi:maltose alpha-D-glucosyltransferase/alpha-amylase
MKRIIALRKRFQAFGRGTIEFLYPENRKVLAFLRRYNDEHILVVANLSRLVQYVDLNLAEFRGSVPIELFGGTEFPVVSDQPLLLTLGPHAYYWFVLEPVGGAPAVRVVEPEPQTIAATSLDDLLHGAPRRALERALPGYLARQRWFRGKARKVRAATIFEVIPLSHNGAETELTFVHVEYVDGDPETYVVPLALAESSAPRGRSGIVCAVNLRGSNELHWLVDATSEPAFAQQLFHLVRARSRSSGDHGALVGLATTVFRELERQADELTPAPPERDQSNTSIAFGDSFILKLYRKLEEGVGLDLELGRFLTAHGFPHSPAVAGAVDYRTPAIERTVAVLHAFQRNEGDAWEFTVDTVTEFFERAAAAAQSAPAIRTDTSTLLALAETPDFMARGLIGTYIESAELIGKRTAELHNALGSATNEPDFNPEPFTPHYQRSVYQTMRNLAGRTLQMLEKNLHKLSVEARSDSRRVVQLQDALLARFRSILAEPISALRIRCHGDYHLGQLLYTGKDFVVTDFEGEPLHPLNERRMKRTPLRDVAGMLRSFDYAAHAPLVVSGSAQPIRAEDQAVLQAWARFWYAQVSAAFLESYFRIIDPKLTPAKPEHTRVILDCYLLEKAIYEIGYELNNRPEWVLVPLRGVLDLLDAA